MRKGIVLSMVAALSIGVLTGCSGSSNKSSKSASNDVKVWVQFSDETAEGKAWEKVVQNFNKKYRGKYKVTTEYIPRSGSGGGYEDKVNAAISTNSLPDVITLDGPNTAAYAKSKVIAPLDKYLKDNNMDDVLDSIKQQGTYDGKFYALKKPWTWDEFKAISQKLKNHFKEAAIDFRLNSNDEMLPYAYMPLIWSNGGTVVNKKGTKAAGYFNAKESVEAVQFIQDLIKQGYTTVSPVEKGFETGKYPMVLSGSWTIADLQTNYKDIDFGILPYPVSNKTKKLVSPSGSWQLAVTTKSNKKVAAAEFVKFATNTESSEILSLGNSVLPIRKSTIKNMQNKVSEPMKFLMEQNAATAHARPVVVAYPQVSRAFQQAMQDISYYKENPSVQKVLDSRAKEMQTAIDDSLNK